MTIAVTGAAGFLGSHVVKHFASVGERVLPLGRRPGPGIEQIASYADVPNADVVVHLGEPADRGVVNASPALAKELSRAVEGLAERFGRRLIYASSAVVYGDRHQRPCRPESPVFPQDAYARLKVENEGRILDAGGTVLRISNLIGRGMATHNVLSDILNQIPGDGAVQVRDGGPVRDYLAVADAARAISTAATALRGGVFNVGSGVGTSVRGLVALALEIAGQRQRAITSVADADSFSYLVLDLTSTVNTLKWNPESSLREALWQLMQHRAP